MNNNQATFIGNWKPTTAGESLLHFLVTNVAELKTLGSSVDEWLPGISRSQSISGFLHGIVVFHVFGRLLQAAKALRTKYVNNENDCLKAIEAFLADKLSITRDTCDNFAELAPLALDAARASSKNSHRIAKPKQIAVQREFENAFNCYSCGAQLDASESEKELPDPEKNGQKKRNPRFAEYEHIWPHSFGGDTIVENLAPVCLFCNDAKENSISWEWTLVQSLLPTADLGQTELDSKHTSRSIKISLHMRAAMLYARTNGTTLKQALRTIGPRESIVTIVDSDDTPDYFNLMVHNPDKTGISWEAT